ncbi:MAG: hypothetical protein PHI59_05955 [Candidatus Omnitrophica bacterium]|nr:hypothetical protein [Candidatus Omnitrophota bacterium]
MIGIPVLGSAAHVDNSYHDILAFEQTFDAHILRKYNIKYIILEKKCYDSSLAAGEFTAELKRLKSKLDAMEYIKSRHEFDECIVYIVDADHKDNGDKLKNVVFVGRNLKGLRGISLSREETISLAHNPCARMAGDLDNPDKIVFYKSGIDDYVAWTLADKYAIDIRKYYDLNGYFMGKYRKPDRSFFPSMPVWTTEECAGRQKLPIEFARPVGIVPAYTEAKLKLKAKKIKDESYYLLLYGMTQLPIGKAEADVLDKSGAVISRTIIDNTLSWYIIKIPSTAVTKGRIVLKLIAPKCDPSPFLIISRMALVPEGDFDIAHQKISKLLRDKEVIDICGSY